MKPVIIGIIGCGNISDAYFKGALRFPEILKVKGCADLNPAAAEAKAALYGAAAMSVEQLLADPDIELLVNLTVPLAHVPVGLTVLAAGKHLYSEKPLGATVAEARQLIEAAAAKGLRIGCAPDTFLGGAPQAARRLVDEGALGQVLSGAVTVMSRGMESWHPNPEFFFKPGGGPVLDIGPYYVTLLINLLGPVARVTASSAVGYPVRTVTSEPLAGSTITVEVPTSVHGVLEFVSGALITFSASWDVWKHGRRPIELYGTEGSLLLPDPNFFGGEILLSRQGGDWQPQDIAAHPFGTPNRQMRDGRMEADHRVIGAVDLAYALRLGRPHRASGALAFHALEVMEALHRSAETGRHVALESRVERPAPLGRGDPATAFEEGFPAQA